MFNLAVTLGILWSDSRNGNSTEMFDVVEQFVVELTTLAMMYSCWETEPGNKLIVDLFSSRTGRLVVCCIGLII